MNSREQRYQATALGKSNRRPDGKTSANYFRNYLPLLPQDRSSRILDFGCGMGHVLHFLREAGYQQAFGVDLSSDCVQYCSDLGLAATMPDDSLGFLRDLDPVQVIICKEVVEHLARSEILSYLTAMRRALAPGGRLILQTENGSLPSGSYVFAKDFTHQTMFTEESLAQALELAGFSRVRLLGHELGGGSIAGQLWRTVRWVSLLPYRGLLWIDRAGAVPTIWDRNLIAVADV